MASSSSSGSTSAVQPPAISAEGTSAAAASLAPQDDVEEILSQNRTTASPFMVRKLEKNAAANWDRFYKR